VDTHLLCQFAFSTLLTFRRLSSPHKLLAVEPVLHHLEPPDDTVLELVPVPPRTPQKIDSPPPNVSPRQPVSYNLLSLLFSVSSFSAFLVQVETALLGSSLCSCHAGLKQFDTGRIPPNCVRVQPVVRPIFLCFLEPNFPSKP